MNVKHISLLFILFSLASSVNAQTEKGNWLIGGESNLSSNILGYSWGSFGSDDTGTSVEFSIAPKAGLFLFQNFVIGAELPLGFSVESDDYSTYTSTDLGIVPFARYYFGAGKIKPFIHAGIGVGRNKLKIEYSDDSFFQDDYDRTRSFFMLDIGGGVSFFLNESVAIELGVGFESSNYNTDYSNDFTGSDFKERGLGLDVGFSIFL